MPIPPLSLDDESSEAEDSNCGIFTLLLQLSDSGDRPCVMWTGYGKKTPVLIFSAQAIIQRVPELKAIGGELVIYVFGWVCFSQVSMGQ